MGFTGYSDLLSYLKLKQIGIDTFYKLRKKVGKMILNKSMEKKETMKKCVFHHYERLGHTPDEDGILNVDVTCDGTYLTRGYKSHIGIVAVIETETGFLLDFEVLSNFCLVCTQLSNKLKLKKLSAEEYNEKIDMHAAKCTHTFEGKSGGMEAEGARILWKRSIEQLNMRYVTFVGDGDSTAFTAVCALNDGKGPYEGIQVKKEECINHVSKRLGTRLRKLKAEEVVEKQTKTGKTFRRSLLGGKNKLTDFVIDKLTNYYGQAVRRNVGKTTQMLRQDILSTFYHVSSTDAFPRHIYCPEGVNSWCFYNKAVAEKKDPPSHSQMKVRFILDSIEDRKKILDVYLSLTQDNLLLRCLKGRTQNPNESIHSKIWSSLSKTHFYGRETVLFSATLTVLQHNFGYEGAEMFLENGSINSGILHRLQLKDKARLRQAQRSTPKKRKREATDDSYAPGEF